MEITKDTIIDKGLPLSRSFILEHLSTGAYHPVLGEFIPKFTARLIPQQSNNIFTPGSIPLWQIARNLQIGAENVVEDLLREFGGDLNIRSGFLNNIPAAFSALDEVQHLIGQSFDISIKGYEDNLYSVAGEIQRIARRSSSMQLVYGSGSWIHMNIDPRKALDTASKIELPTITSIDQVTGVVEAGISPLRGFA